MTAKTHITNRVERDDISRCPFCGSAELEREDRECDGKEYWEAYTCRDCEREFTEVYTYKFTEYTEEVVR